MKQSDNCEAFFNMYGFTQTLQMKCPESGEPMHFEGLEARYVCRIQRQVAECEKYIQQLMEQLRWLRDQEFHKWQNAENKQRKHSGTEPTK